ncbi:MAG: aspartate aminotransferase family protein [Bacteroidales bacterium]|jgi:acetylornithine/N-succinyldiaminopimelate aminotransferase|nr:aspartate aminotransferase family protein [Bacteroidales bacterium]
MNLFDVYSLFDVTPVRAKGCTVWDDRGQEYLDLYGGHAVISVGHSHPHYVEALKAQLDKIGFYSNSVRNPLQEELARRIGEVSGYEDYALFLDNSGAESNENAAKLASFHTGKDRIVAFRRSFHGRTSGAVALTDNPAIVSPFNAHHRVSFVDLNDTDAVEEELRRGDVAAVIVEGIQGCGGIHVPGPAFLQALSRLCGQYGAALILDEVQSGYGRTGKFFAHQWAGIRPDIITMGKGIANGFPCGGILISPKFQARKGMLGTTFGGNYLACAGALAVLDILEREDLLANALAVGDYIQARLPSSPRIKEVRGKGLMLGIEMNEPVAPLRQALLYDKHVFTGVAGQNMIRLLAPLCLTKAEADRFLEAFKEVLG